MDNFCDLTETEVNSQLSKKPVDATIYGDLRQKKYRNKRKPESTNGPTTQINTHDNHVNNNHKIKKDL